MVSCMLFTPLELTYLYCDEITSRAHFTPTFKVIFDLGIRHPTHRKSKSRFSKKVHSINDMTLAMSVNDLRKTSMAI